MAELFRAKVRQIGTSAGILISQERLRQEAIRIVYEIELAILPHAKDFSGFGMAKSAKIPFTRDKKARAFT